MKNNNIRLQDIPWCHGPKALVDKLVDVGFVNKCPRFVKSSDVGHTDLFRTYTAKAKGLRLFASLHANNRDYTKSTRWYVHVTVRVTDLTDNLYLELSASTHVDAMFQFTQFTAIFDGINRV